MCRNHFALIIFAFLFSFSGHGKVYTFDELLDLAEKNSISTEIVKTNILATRSRIGRLESDYFPRINAVLGGEKIDINAPEGTDTSNFVANIEIDYNLFRFGATAKSIEALRAVAKNQEGVLKASKRNVYREIKKYYTESLHLKELKKVLDEELKFNKSLRVQVRTKHKQGLVGQADVLEIDMRDATLQQKLLVIEEELDHSKDIIRKLTLIPHTQAIELEGEVHHEHFDADPGELIEAGKRFNVSFLKSVAEAASASSLLASSKYRRLPEVNLKGTYGRTPYIDRVTSSETQTIFGVYLDIPIWDGGERKSVSETYKALLAQKTLEMNQIERNLGIEIMHKYEKMKNIHRQVDLAETNVKNGKEYFKKVLGEYNRGVKNSIDLVSARDRLLNFISDLIIARKDFIVSKLELEEVAGVSFD